jgi:hypothetical protein
MSAVTPAGLKPIPYVVIKRADGSLALRHPDEIKPVGYIPPASSLQK